MSLKTDINIRLFLVFLLLVPFIDFFNGFFLSVGISLPVGIVYRFVFFLFLFISICFRRVDHSIYTCITLLFFFGNLSIYLAQSIFYKNTLTIIITDFASIVKYFLWLFIPYYVYQSKKWISPISYNNMCIMISCFFTLFLLIPFFLGVGNQTYEGSNVGYKGYFFANNDTTLAFIFSVFFTVIELIKQLEKKWGIKTFLLSILFLGNLLSLLLIGTKLGILSAIVASVFFVFNLFLLFQRMSIKKKLFLFVITISFILMFIFKGVNYITQITTGTYERMSYFYNLYGQNLIQLMSSSRSEFLVRNFDTTFNNTSVFAKLFGYGFENRINDFGRFGLIEMDFFDVYFSLGILGTILLTMILMYFINISLKKGNRTMYSIILSIFILYSFFAGHVFFSALSSTLFGIILGGIILKQRE